MTKHEDEKPVETILVETIRVSRTISRTITQWVDVEVRPQPRTYKSASTLAEDLVQAMIYAGVPVAWMESAPVDDVPIRGQLMTENRTPARPAPEEPPRQPERPEPEHRPFGGGV